MVRASDVAGNTASSTVTINIDTTPPGLSVNPLPTTTNVPDVTITGTVEMGAEVFLNGMSLGEAVDATLSIDHTLHEGTNIIVLEAKDMAGNMAMQTITVRLDTHEPVLVVTGPSRGLVTNEDSVTVTGIVEVGATLTVGGTQVMPDESGAFTHEFTLSSGENSIEVKATDDATNVAMVTIDVVQDQDPPHLEITDPDDGDVTALTRIDVTLVSDDDVMLWLNGRMLSEAGTVSTSLLLVEGMNTITARAMDEAGNVATVTITVTRDTEPPSLTITKPETVELMTNSANVEIEGVALKATSVRAGGVTATLRVDETFTVSVPLNDGVNEITVEASDGVNVVSQTIKVMVNRDTPVLVVDAVEAVVKSPSVTISGTTDPGIDHVMVSHTGFEGTFPVAYDGTFGVTLNLVDGTYDVKVTVEDDYGNTAERSTGGFNVKAQDIDGGGDGDGEGFTVEPIHIGLILAVVGIALIIAAYVSANYITKRRREELDESD
jgi:nitrogen fixation protein FixH